MRTQSWILLFLMASGCVFTDLKEIPRPIGIAPGEDAGADSTTDIGVDVSADAATDTDPPPIDMAPDSDPLPDMTLPDMNVEPDMPPAICWGPRKNLTSGKVCESTAVMGDCNIVIQDCVGEAICEFAFKSNTPPPVPVCVNVAECNYLKVGENCMEKPGQVSRSLGKCEGGAYCPSATVTGSITQCRWYCELESGLGCQPDESCRAIEGTMGAAQTAAGYGICQPGLSCIPQPI